ncbi:hypothetical protein J2755_002174 [Methanohalophilus levihalophilus]|uniref:hypothetical protein n=1 Tax=Methanohalophilus levihalophilus TaxID=1431282 RepID=UPI001AE34B0B|nr:hypothetical protein [Methanohalophilus levihalophilus]MBP2031211.1 hypothetical protein [Methanohalophilus levihalophilus]
MNDLFERYKKWVDGGHALSEIEPFMVPVVHGIGQIDRKLIFNDTMYCELIAKTGSTGSTDEENMEYNEHIMISYLWVLGAYEIVRSIDQRVDKNRGGDPELLDEDLNARVKKVKKNFERIRIPLAKFEPARSHEDTDAPIAYPYTHMDLGFAWRVSQDTFISRRELSNDLLELLVAIRDRNVIDTK